MLASDPVLQLVAAALVLTAAPAAVLLLRPVRRGMLVAAIAAGLAAATSVLALDAQLALREDPLAALLDAAAAAAVTIIVTVVSADRWGSRVPLRAPLAAVQAGIWGGLAIGPVLAATVGTVPSFVQRALDAVDATGVLALFTAPAAALFVLALIPAAAVSVRPGPDSAHAPQPSSTAGLPPRPSRLRSALAIGLLALGAAAWMVGVERVVSDATGRLVVNAGAGILLGVLSWLVVARIVGRGRPRGGAVLGAALGWAAVGAGGAFLAPLGLVAAAVVGASAGTAIVLRAPVGADPVRRAALGIIVATAIGGLIATILADGFGLAASGATLGLLTQVVAVVVVALVSALAALVGWCAAAAAGRLVGAARGRAAEIEAGES
ncbi:hypothetical protein [Microcella frigidaquae]|uniref:Ammonium transporter AmtB-like domain-containing protein n=1 Tax=Microcella frigidaquae TaxID=424758 RepID=A0A840XE87_9MICO|nr:hypothetical protein [Microcella frigidaquae]MBB5616636.1 hypothetical protein [Microcella frigidaquae]NHN43922.1 hypothetical protein [Microcella frigidaquae]